MSVTGYGYACIVFIPFEAKDLFRGKMAVYLTDGREVIVPVSMFKDISAMPIKERNKWYILDDQYFTFENMGRVYSITDVMNYNMVQH